MNALFLVSFIAGLALSFISVLHMPRVPHMPRMPRMIRHAAGRRSRSSMINAAAMTAFLVWFGGSGLLLERLTDWRMAVLIAAASAIGVAGGALINGAIGALARRESVAASLSMIGVIGRTVVAIRGGDGTGEIVFTHAGTRRVAGARSESGRAISKGTEVVVTRYERGIAYVTTWDDLAPHAARIDELQEG